MLANYGLILDVEGDDIDNIVYNPFIGKSFLNMFLFKRIELEKLLRSKIDEVHEAAKKLVKLQYLYQTFFMATLKTEIQTIVSLSLNLLKKILINLMTILKRRTI